MVVVCEMFEDDVAETDMRSCRATWKGEIDEWLEQLKAAEKELGRKEKELRRREMILRHREQKLEEQFNVVVCIHSSVIVSYWYEGLVMKTVHNTYCSCKCNLSTVVFEFCGHFQSRWCCQEGLASGQMLLFPRLVHMVK